MQKDEKGLFQVKLLFEMKAWQLRNTEKDFLVVSYQIFECSLEKRNDGIFGFKIRVLSIDLFTSSIFTSIEIKNTFRLLPNSLKTAPSFFHFNIMGAEVP